MNEEIKEILARLSRYVIIPDVRHDFDDLLDYITTLQEENKELNDDNIWWNNRFKAVERDNRDYKSRIDKAIAYIECGKTFDDIETARIIDKYEKILLEILKGDSSNE